MTSLRKHVSLLSPVRHNFHNCLHFKLSSPLKDFLQEYNKYTIFLQKNVILSSQLAWYNVVGTKEKQAAAQQTFVFRCHQRTNRLRQQAVERVSAGS